MLPRRLANTRPLLHAFRNHTPRASFPQIRQISQADIEDPDMNGGYISPPAQKRQFRDPHGDWWDKQERRNYGEPLHQDNDILGMFSLEEYTHFTPGKAAALFGTFVLAVLGLCVAVGYTYPDKKSAPRTWPDGLEKELGGKGALLALKDEDV